MRRWRWRWRWLRVWWRRLQLRRQPRRWIRGLHPAPVLRRSVAHRGRPGAAHRVHHRKGPAAEPDAVRARRGQRPARGLRAVRRRHRGPARLRAGLLRQRDRGRLPGNRLDHRTGERAPGARAGRRLRRPVRGPQRVRREHVRRDRGHGQAHHPRPAVRLVCALRRSRRRAGRAVRHPGAVPASQLRAVPGPGGVHVPGEVRLRGPARPQLPSRRLPAARPGRPARDAAGVRLAVVPRAPAGSVPGADARGRGGRGRGDRLQGRRRRAVHRSAGRAGRADERGRGDRPRHRDARGRPADQRDGPRAGRGRRPV